MSAKKTKAAPKRDLGCWLWLATDGEVRVARGIPAGGHDLWLGFPAEPPLTDEEADAILAALCDLAPPSRIADGGPKTARWFFRSDPRTQGDLREKFGAAVALEAGRRPCARCLHFLSEHAPPAPHLIGRLRGAFSPCPTAECDAPGCQARGSLEMVEKIIEAAVEHGEENGDAAFEAGDIAEALRACWGRLTAADRVRVFEGLELWGKEGSDGETKRG